MKQVGQFLMHFNFYCYHRSEVKVAQSCPTLCNLMDYTVHEEFSRPEYWSGCPFPSPRSSQSRDRTQVSALQADSLSAQPQGNPKNTGVGSLSFLQWTVPTQGLNRGLLHCRWILYQLSYQGSSNIY